MNAQCTLVKDLIKESPIFVYEKSTLFNALKTMEKFRIENLPVVREDFSVKGVIRKKDILRILEEKNVEPHILNKLFVEYLLNKNDRISSVCAYPGMDIKDVYKTMKEFNLKEMPVIDFLWDKKLVGNIWIEDVKKMINMVISR